MTNLVIFRAKPILLMRIIAIFRINLVVFDKNSKVFRSNSVICRTNPVIIITNTVVLRTNTGIFITSKFLVKACKVTFEMKYKLFKTKSSHIYENAILSRSLTDPV